ncbi:MAG: efflux RND transporter periplasmic adaptor subunit, partial [Planctomycetales bacterium]|nr:efflux RND transporter periplasmic adaptor subunit [Planctomycetales bacterium]
MLKNASQKGLITGKKLTLFAVVAVSAGVLWLGVQNLVGQGEGKQPFVFYTVKKSDLPIVVTERGSLDSQVETKVICQVENSSSDRSGNVGTQIIFIVPNGSPVKEGDLLVEFDSASIRDRLDTQVLAYQKAISAKTQAESKYQNQLLQNETALKEAELAVQLAELEREMYVDPTSGTFQLAVEEIERQIDEAKNSVLESRSALELAQVDYTGMKQLFELGYRGKSDLRQSRLKLLQAEDRLASSFNQIKTYQSNRTKLTNYERKMQLLQLDGAVQTAKRNLVQVNNDNESSAAQALAAKVEAESTEQKELERLERYEAQLENSKIFAPHDGMVVYARPDRRGGGEIMEGAIVRERQEICTLPDMSLMEVKTQVHEAVLDQIRAGLTASVRVDAFPGSVYPAVVSKVAVVPSSDGGWFNTSSVKTYETVVKITGKVEDLKPGMTAVVDMHVDRLEGVVSIPVQAVIQVERDTWCYVAAGDGVERRDIKLG